MLGISTQRLLTGQQTLLHIGLDSPQQKRPQDLVQRRYDLRTRFRLLIIRLISLVEETVQVGVIAEDLRTDEVEQRKQLLEIILEGRAGDEHTPAGVVGADDLGEEGVHVLDPVRLVDDDVAEGELLEVVLLADADLVGGDEDLEVVCEEAVVDGVHLSVCAVSTGACDGGRRHTLSSGVPCSTTALKSGTQCLNSRAQFCSVLFGTMTRWGPGKPL